MVKLKICEGKYDPNHKLCDKHKWNYYIEKGGKDNKAYPYCTKCKLLCRISIPSECLPKKISKLVTASQLQDPRKNCGCD